VNTTFKSLCLAALAVFAIASCGGAPDAAKRAAPASETAVATAGQPQTACPVMGSPINKNVFVDHDGKRIYFCCPGCDGTFKKDPAKYMAKLAAAGVVLEDTPSESGAQ
jgi:YHS domain-containing protein